MGDKSAIEWTDATWNPVTGCTKVSQGCKNCYAERVFPRAYGSERKFTDVRTHPERLDQPLRWAKPRRIFVNSMSDLFHEDIPDEFIAEVFANMAYARQHTFQVLTKRPERMLKLLTSEQWQGEYDSATTLVHDMACEILGRRGEFDPNQRLSTDIRAMDPALPRPNVWLGVSVEDQATADERIPLLLQTPATVRFISAEPLLGPIDLDKTPPIAGSIPVNGATIAEISGCLPHWQSNPMRAKLRGGLDWVIAGGESGPHARASHPDWFRSLRDQCAAASVAYFFKQWGQWLPGSQYTDELSSVDTDEVFSKFKSLRWDGERFDEYDPLDPSPGEETYCVGKKAAGRELDGRTHDEYPA